MPWRQAARSKGTAHEDLPLRDEALLLSSNVDIDFKDPFVALHFRSFFWSLDAAWAETFPFVFQLSPRKASGRPRLRNSNEHIRERPRRPKAQTQVKDA